MRWAIWTVGALGLIWLMWRFASWTIDRQILLLALAGLWVLSFFVLAAGEHITKRRAADAARLERMSVRCAMCRASYVRQHGEAAAAARESENQNIWADIARASEPHH